MHIFYRLHHECKLYQRDQERDGWGWHGTWQCSLNSHPCLGKIVHLHTNQDALNCTLVVSIEDADFLTIFCVPNVNSTVRWATEE